jgi:hypothetical protein
MNFFHPQEPFAFGSTFMGIRSSHEIIHYKTNQWKNKQNDKPSNRFRRMAKIRNQDCDDLNNKQQQYCDDPEQVITSLNQVLP